MAALNQTETESLSLASRTLSDTAMRLKRASDAVHTENDMVEMDFAEVEVMIDRLKKAESLINTIKQMKGYYPK